MLGVTPLWAGIFRSICPAICILRAFQLPPPTPAPPAPLALRSCMLPHIGFGVPPAPRLSLCAIACHVVTGSPPPPPSLSLCAVACHLVNGSVRHGRLANTPLGGGAHVFVHVLLWNGRYRLSVGTVFIGRCCCRGGNRGQFRRTFASTWDRWGS